MKDWLVNPDSVLGRGYRSAAELTGGAVTYIVGVKITAVVRHAGTVRNALDVAEAVVHVWVA